MKSKNSKLKLNFFKIFIETCRGTEIFPELMNFSVLKALFHLFFLSLLVSLFIASARYHEINLKFDNLKKEFGDIKITEKGILPTRNSGKKRIFKSAFIPVYFFPEGNVNEKVIDEIPSPLKAVWTPETIFLFSEKSVWGQYILMPLLAGDKTNRMVFFSKFEDIKKYIKKNVSAENGYLDFRSNKFYKVPSTLKADEFLSGFPFFVALSIFLTSMFIIIFYAVTINLFNTFFMSLSAKDAAPWLNFKKLFVAGIYACFPPIFIASFFPALDLPYLQYDWAFFISFIIYIFAVYIRLQKWGAKIS